MFSFGGRSSTAFCAGCPYLNGQDLGPATPGKPRLTAATDCLAPRSSQTAEANTGRPNLLSVATAGWGDWKSALMIVKAETVIAWHRKGFRLFWTWRIRRGKPGRPKVPQEIRDLIRMLSRNNPGWGAPRIHGELLKLGIEITEPTVAKYMVRHRKPPSQTWRTFLGVIRRSVFQARDVWIHQNHGLAVRNLPSGSAQTGKHDSVLREDRCHNRTGGQYRNRDGAEISPFQE